MSKPVQVEVVLSHSEHLPVVDVWLIVDILRASTVMVRWFEMGGTELYPAGSVESALQLAERLRSENGLQRDDPLWGRSPLLMGEQNAIAPEGFDLGNSPLDITREVTKSNPSAVISTTNGTKAILKAAGTGTPVLIACARNAFAVLDLALSKGKRIGIFCSGRKGRPAWDDTLCAGLLVARLTERFGDIRLADNARLAHLAWTASSDFEASLKTADHAVFLNRIGFGGDIAFAAEVDSARSVPELHELPEGDGMRAVLREGLPQASDSGDYKPLVADFRASSKPQRGVEAVDMWQERDLFSRAPEDGGHVFFAGDGYRKQHRGKIRKP